MYIEYDTLKKESDRLVGLARKMNSLTDEIKNIGIRLSEDMETECHVPELNRISSLLDMDCEEIRRAARCLTYITELCIRCSRRVCDSLEDAPVYREEVYDWIENDIRKEVRISLEDGEET